MERLPKVRNKSSDKFTIRTRWQARSLGAYSFVSVYVIFLLCLGAAPTGYVLALAFEKNTPAGGFAGFSNFISTFRDYRFLPAFENIGLYLTIWLVTLVVLVLALALMVHDVGGRLSSSLRFIYYMPGALVGAASVIVWLFMFDPPVSPIASILRIFGFSNFVEVVATRNLPVVFAVMAFWTGAGGWIIVMYGALNNIPTEVLEAARIDGCGRMQLALLIKIPLIKKWIAYMVILSIAGGTQVFVEPTLISSASQGVVTPYWSPQELAYSYAFTQNNFNGAAAISVDLLVFALACAAVIVSSTGLFERS